MGLDDSVIEGLARVVIRDRASEGEPHGRAAGGRVAPEVDSEQTPRLKAPCGLLADLAHHGGEEGLAALYMTGRLVVDQPSADTGGSIPSRLTTRVTPDW